MASKVPTTFTHVLLVEPDRDALAALRQAWSSIAPVEAYADYETARRSLLEHAPDLLVTNLCLGVFSGLQLVNLAAATAPKTRSVAYADVHDPGLAREAQFAGAFYERRFRLPFVLRAYAFQSLPPRDRRDPNVIDRRLSFRGGRRAAELVAATQETVHLSTEAILGVSGPRAIVDRQS